MLGTLVSLVLLLELVVATGSKRYLAHSVHEERPVGRALPSGWAKRSLTSTTTNINDEVSFDKKSLKIPMKIRLAQRNLHRADELLMDVSSPSSPNYGKHWSAAQVLEMFSPSEESVGDVLEWLKDAGFGRERVEYAKAHGTVTVEMTVAEAEDLLHTEYHVYDHASSGKPRVGCSKYSVPSAIKHHVDFITPTLHFDTPLGLRKSRTTRAVDTNEERAVTHPSSNDIAKQIGQPSNAGSYPVELHYSETTFSASSISAELTNCDKKVTPLCLQALYKFSPKTQLSSQKNSYGIVEYTPQSYLPADLDTFARNFTPKAVGYRPKLESIDGGTLGGTIDPSLNGESNLDLTYGIALTYPTDITLYQTGDNVEGASFNDFLDALDATYCTSNGGDDPTQDATYPDPDGGYQGPKACGTNKATNVISTSYGYNEHDLTPFYENRQCNEYMKLGLLGVTVLYSSGDFGVAGNSGQCIIPSTGEYGDGANATQFNPSFPGTCPWITSVGATQINPNSTVFAPESACEQVIYSGGGFSNVFPIPSYQKKAVSEYFQNHKPSYSSVQYNNSMTTRGFPDISANGANYAVPIGGVYYRVYGTSASSPVVGAIITLVNDARITLGKKPVGFLNPLLYAYPWALNDITSGGNQGCGTPGFSAVPGWDPVTGLGTPNFPKLVIAALLN